MLKDNAKDRKGLGHGQLKLRYRVQLSRMAFTPILISRALSLRSFLSSLEAAATRNTVPTAVANSVVDALGFKPTALR